MPREGSREDAALGSGPDQEVKPETCTPQQSSCAVTRLRVLPTEPCPGTSFLTLPWCPHATLTKPGQPPAMAHHPPQRILLLLTKGGDILSQPHEPGVLFSVSSRCQFTSPEQVLAPSPRPRSSEPLLMGIGSIIKPICQREKQRPGDQRNLPKANWRYNWSHAHLLPRALMWVLHQLC